MSFAEWSDNKHKKKKKEGQTFAEWSNEKYGVDDIAPIRTSTTLTGDDIAPPVKTGLSFKDAIGIANEYKKKNSVFGTDFFKKPESFDDKEKAKSVGKAILGTGADFSLNVLTGVGNFVEGIGDTINYGIADISEKAGNKDFADALREETKKSVVQYLLGETTEKVDKWSALDKTSDSVAQGLGMITTLGAGGMALGNAGLGVAGQTAVTTGGTLFSGIGSGMSEAYEGGATDEEARTYGLISGASEALSEMLFGGLGKGLNSVGLGKGLSSADDMLAKKVSNMFSSQITKNLAEYGIKAGAEGFEEVLAGIAQAIGKKMTYMSEKDFLEILKEENLLEQFIVGSVTSGFAQVGDFYTSAKTGTDFISGLTENEQKVVDKEVENRIAERKEKGEKVTNKDKSKIYDEVVKALDKGYISIDTIESALGGETYDSYKSVTEQEEALQDEFNTLNKMKQGDMTGEQSDRKAELKQQLEELKKNSKRTQIKEQLSNEVFGLAKGSRLAESYNEKARRGKSFEADLSKYDTKQQEVIKKAVESGILNNTNRTHEFVDMIAKISADKGVLFDFTNNEKLKTSGFALEGKTVNGYKTEDGNIALNMQSQKALESVVGHEITHILEGTELYDALQEAVKQYATTKGEYAERMQSLRELYTKVYKGTDFDTKLREELTADIIGDYLFSDSDFINSLSTEQPNLFKKIYNEIKYLCKVATAGSKEARELEKVKKAFDKAYKDTTKNTTDEGGAKYSVSKSFSEQVDDVISGSHNPRYDLYVSETPQYLVDLNFKEGPLLMRNSKIREILDAHPEMDEGIIKALPEAMAKPTLVLKSKTHPTESVVVITDIMTQKGEAIVPVWVNQEGSYIDVDLGETNTETNFVASYYGRNIKHLIEYADANDGFLYQSDDIEKVRQLLARNGLQLPTPLKLSNSIITLPQKPKSVNTQLSSSEDYVETNSKAVMTNERIDYLIEDSGAGSRQDYANYWITSISPSDFINLTTTEKTQDRDFFDSWGSEWNPESNMSTYDYMGELKKNMRQTPYLAIDINTGEVVGHEGRHRMRALEQNGITSAEIRVEFRDEDGRIIKYSPDGKRLRIKDAVQIINQFGTKQTATIENIIPLNKDYRNEILANYGEKTAQQNDIRYSLSEETDYSRAAEMQIEVNQLTQSIKEIENSDEFKLQMNKLTEAIGNDDVDNGIKAYKQWEEESGYRAIREKRDALREEIANFHKKMQEDYSRKALEEEKNAIAKSGLSEADYFRKQAVKEFGYTPYFYDAGYITPNGKMLNFSGEKGKHYGSRGQDHRGISIIYAETSGTDALNRFVKDGNIRIMAESPGIDISTAAEPTKEQYSTIRRFIYEYIDKEYFNIDFTDESGKVIGSLQYENRINPTRILNDIKHFYATGEIRGQSDIEKYLYSLSKEGEQPAKNGRFYGKDMLLDLPIRKDIAKNATTTFDDIAPMTEAEAKAMRNDVPLTDADVPPEIDVPMYDETESARIDDTTIKGIGQRLRETLSLTAEDTKAIQEVVQKYSTKGLPNKTEIFDEIREKFGEHRYKQKNEELIEVKQALKGFGIFVSDEVKSSIPDYSAWRKKYQGKLHFSKDGLSIDDLYGGEDAGLSKAYPDFFPADITESSDQLLRIAEVVDMDRYTYGSRDVDTDLIQEATDIIYDEVNKYKENELTQHLAEEQSHFYRGITEEETAEGSTAKTVKERIADELKNARAELLMNQQLRDESQADYEKEISRLQAVYNGKRDKNTKVANDILRRIERLQRMKNDVAADYSKRISDIENRIAKMESKDYATVEQRKTKQQELKTQMENLVGDTSTWIDKKLGISYKVNTLRRNLRDIVRDANGKRDIAKADAIYDELQGKYNHNEAELNREANRIKQQFAEMKITKAEDTYIQMLGELRHNPETTLTEEVVKDFYNKHKKHIDEAKVDKAIEMARPLYDDLLSRVNQVLSEQGMKEIPYRKGYFPHFTEDKQGFLAKLLNWKTKNNDIPTDIAGLTEEFSPNRSWQSFNKQRKGDTTDYSFLKGLDTYVQGSLDWIYHIEDIQKRRALENHIRYVHSEKGIQERIDAIRNNEEYDANEMQDQIDIVYKEAGNPLNNFITDFRTATNTLAGKKSSLDRGMEEMTNRQFYSTMTNLSNRVSANMVAGSISSALTNFIPITQSWGQVSPISSLRAMGETIKSTFRDDGTINKSDFLTNRLRQSESLYKGFWDKAGDKVGILMESIDSFTSQTIWRSKYHENISKGMSENEAIRNADQFAENVLAGRSRGNAPTIFDSKNPLAKIFTVFQLEVNNQYGYMFKDMPQDLANESKRKLVQGYVTMFLGAYAYNALYSSLVGRDAAFDPIGIIKDLLRDLGVVGGDDEEEEEIEPTDVILNLTNNIVEELPFVGGLLGGGRIPLSSALPYGGIKEAWEGSLEDLSEGNKWALTREWLNPVFYLAMPMGGGQLKKTVEGLKMFDDDLPIAGSYTDSGNLRFPVEDTPQNRVQAALFGQYANENARAYFDNDIAPLKEKQIQEYIDLDLPIADYWKVREGLKDLETLNEKGDYIGDLDLPISKKNILINNIADRDKPIDYKDFDLYSDFEEFDFATRYPEKYKVLQEQGVSVAEYKEKYEESVFMYTDDFSWASKNPEKYTLSKAVTDDVMKYKQYTTDLYNIKADKDSNGKSISGSRKKKVLDYINNLDIEFGAKCILLKSEYSSEDRYNKVIVDYLIGRDDITYEEKKTILEELGATVDSNGYIHW